MNSNNQTNLNENDSFVSEEDTEVSLPPAPNFEAAQPAPVQPVIPVAHVAGDPAGVFPQQPQVVYVAHPTMVEPRHGWGWIPAALALLVIAIVAGVFIGAELYKRSIYAESNAPYTNRDVSPYANSTANENKSDKLNEENSLAGKKENSSSSDFKSGEVKSESRQINTVSTGFTQIQQTELKENETAGNVENADKENDRDAKTSSEEENSNVKAVEKENQQSPPVDEDAPPPPAKGKSKQLQPRKVENVKDTENIEPPQRNIRE